MAQVARHGPKGEVQAASQGAVVAVRLLKDSGFVKWKAKSSGSGRAPNLGFDSFCIGICFGAAGHLA